MGDIKAPALYMDTIWPALLMGVLWNRLILLAVAIEIELRLVGFMDAGLHILGHLFPLSDGRPPGFPEELPFGNISRFVISNLMFYVKSRGPNPDIFIDSDRHLLDEHAFGFFFCLLLPDEFPL